MVHFGTMRDYQSVKMPVPEIDTFSLFLCRPEEQAFINGCNNLIHFREEQALRDFKRAGRYDLTFHDAWFMEGFLHFVNGRVEDARTAFLHILRQKEPFNGYYIIRFLPTFRPQVNLFEDFVFHIMPTTGDVAAALARIYLIEGRNREAKKIIHPAFRKFPMNSAIQAVWAQSMLATNAPDGVISDIDRAIGFHKSRTDLDQLVTYLNGRAHLDKGDFRSGINHLEGLLHHTRDKNPRLMDRFRILTALEFEKKGYLINAIEHLKTVEDSLMEYETGITVELKCVELIAKVRTYIDRGITRPLEYERAYLEPRDRTMPTFLELENEHGMEGSF